ncbi:hypothetical protein ACFWXA_30785 [Streptomyces atroolivaceus]|uniref:hypothetical protein n=1 Tax=Streptomyces atroolivaceus TaxID=66869 RepID=UPI00365492E2
MGGCACNKGKRQQWEVVLDGGNGKVLNPPYSSQATAKAVSKRYAGSIVREKAKETATTAKKA